MNDQTRKGGANDVSGQTQMRELVFHLAEAIKSNDPSALNKLKEQHQGQIRAAEEGIRRLCKKKYKNFLQANS